jgi:hypothetical protein
MLQISPRYPIGDAIQGVQANGLAFPLCPGGKAGVPDHDRVFQSMR